jgi:16S rRNA processing protein RimM
VVLGRVVGAHGLRGQIRVRWLGDGPEHLLAAKKVGLADGRGIEDPLPPAFEIEGGGRGRAGEVRLALRGVDQREGAEALRGRLVTVDSAELPRAQAGEAYWFELVGCQVETPNGDVVGRVRELWDTPAHATLVVVGVDGRERLIPAAPALLRQLDVAAKRIVIEDLPGLIDPIE